jgi:uncharacterized protein (DUF433 family)
MSTIGYIYAMTMHLERITTNRAICHGKPCIRGMRWPVEVVLDLLGSGMTIPDILADHPELEREDITASLNVAKLLMSGQSPVFIA